MRLLHAKTLEFQVFHDNEIPRYLILSHTWGMEEISYQEMRFLQQHHALPDSLKSDTTVMAALEAAAGLKIFAMNSKSIQARAGYRKIQKAAKLAREKGLKYIWIDTCCIDKSSSAELQEAINSMYRWYQQSCFCMVHLEDAGPVRNPGSDLRRHYDIATILRTSRWITRGWTLQELIAPKALAFYDQNFALIGSKSMFCPTIAEVTGIPLSVLRTGDLSQASVAQKMSWAANRKTTRAEDRAYSLMGLFGIHMPMLYGEGDNAFRRLQEEIMRRTPDDSIFAWRAPDGSLSRYCGLLAMSPDDFEGSQGIEQGRGQFATSNLGLRIEARLCPLLDDIPGEMWDDSIFALPLGAIEKGRIIALLIRRLGASHYTRVAANTFSHRLNDNGKPEAIYIEHTPKIPKIFRSRAMHCFQFKFDSTVYRIRSAQPKQLWDPIHSDLSINPEFCTNNGSDNNGYPGAPVFYGTVRLYYQNRNFPLACSINFGHNLVTGRVWLKLLGSASTPIEPNWRSVCQEPESYDELLCPEPLVQVLNISNSEAVRVTVHCGLHRGMISYIVHIVQQKYMLPPVLRT